jgi:hypothetical protein
MHINHLPPLSGPGESKVIANQTRPWQERGKDAPKRSPELKSEGWRDLVCQGRRVLISLAF